MDLADQCDMQNEILAKYMPHKPEGPKPNGRCHWCDEPVADGRGFCDGECRADYERFKR